MRGAAPVPQVQYQRRNGGLLGTNLAGPMRRCACGKIEIRCRTRSFPLEDSDRAIEPEFGLAKDGFNTMSLLFIFVQSSTSLRLLITVSNLFR